jgi:hypothetical protein
MNLWVGARGAANPVVQLGGSGTAIAIVLSRCAKKNDAISNGEKSESGRSSIAQTRAIAEGGFIFGLPIVMYYTSTYELFLDPTSSQYKAPIDRAFYNKDWLKRASAAKGGIFGNSSIEAMYPLTQNLPSGEPHDCSKHKYNLTFAKAQLPPVNAFWSVTMYDGKTQFLIDNPINRYLINSPMLPQLKTNPDGSITIYIQKDSPGKTKESNWLSAPDGPVYLVMRLDWPKETPPSILPAGDGTWKPRACDASGVSCAGIGLTASSPDTTISKEDRFGQVKGRE